MSQDLEERMRQLEEIVEALIAQTEVALRCISDTWQHGLLRDRRQPYLNGVTLLGDIHEQLLALREQFPLEKQDDDASKSDFNKGD